MALRSRLLPLLVALSLAAGVSACQSNEKKQPADDPVATGAADAKATQCAEQVLDQMDRPQRVGQLLMVGVSLAKAPRAERWVKEAHLGGILITGSSSPSTDDVRKVVNALNRGAGDGPKPFVAVKQEGGQVQTLQGKAFGALPAPSDQGKWTAQETVGTLSKSAAALRDAGVTMSLSPVADTVLTDPVADNPVVGKNGRSFSSSPNQVATQVHLAIQALSSQQVLPVISSFPGQGRLTQDPASALAKDDVTTADDPQLVPFRTGIEAGAQVVQVSAAYFTKLDDEQQAVVSPRVIGDLLRDKLGFAGVVLSADLSHPKVLADVPLDQRGVQFVHAGGDLVLAETSSASPTLLEGMLAEDKKSPVFAKKVDAAALRILALKAEHDIISCR